MKKIIATVLALSTCLLLCACGNGNTENGSVGDIIATENAAAAYAAIETLAETIPEIGEEPSAEVAALVATEISDEIRSIYEEVLEQYRQAVLMDSREFFKLYTNSTERDIQFQSIVDSAKTTAEKTEELMKWLELQTLESTYPYINQIVLNDIHMYREEGDLYGKYHDLYYTNYDVDGNGTPELLICDRTGSRDNLIGLYTIRDQEPYTFENSTGHRSYLTLYTDGTICVDISGGASLHFWNFYRINREWNMLDSVSDYMVNFDYPESETIWKNLEEYMATLTPVTEYDWQPLFPEQ